MFLIFPSDCPSDKLKINIYHKCCDFETSFTVKSLTYYQKPAIKCESTSMLDYKNSFLNHNTVLYLKQVKKSNSFFLAAPV